MQQRSIFYTLEQILSADLLGAQVYGLIGDSNTLQAVLGSTQSVISNLLLSPTDPSSLTLNVTNGFLASLQPVDASSYGSLSANTQSVLQLAFNLQTNVVINQTLEAGQAQYVLIEAGFQQQDSDAQVLPYVNISNPAVPYNGPGNTGIAQDTIRNEVCVLTVKYGTPATSGSEVPPVVDSGQVAVAYVDLEAAQTTITSGQILDPTAVVNLTGHGSPTQILAGLLQSHHDGEVGQAPPISLDGTGTTRGLKEVQGLLRMVNIFGSNAVGAVSAYRQGSGNPNGVLAGNSNNNGAADTYYDYTNNIWYVCTTTGNTSTTVWTSTNLPASHQLNEKVFTSSGSYTPSSGTKYISVTVVGSGGGGATGDTGGASGGGGGGGGGTAFAVLPTTGLTFPATITIGTGGAGGAGGASVINNGINGNNSSFSTPEIGTNLIGYAGEGGYAPGSSGLNLRIGGRGGGLLTSAPFTGTITIGSIQYPYINIYGGCGDGTGAGSGGSVGGTGGSSTAGGGGRGGQASGSGSYTPSSSGGLGSGGGGGGANSSGTSASGANGTIGICIIQEFVGN